MESVTLENFRCFREKQTVKLAPLTLLVGENSTGKTSFLALIRALMVGSLEYRPFTFSTPTYDLGSYKEIAYNSDGQSAAESFTAGFRMEVDDLDDWLQSGIRHFVPVDLEFTFRKDNRGTFPVLARQRIAGEDSWVEEEKGLGNNENHTHVSTRLGTWRFQPTHDTPVIGEFGDFARYLAVRGSLARSGENVGKMPELSPLGDSPQISKDDFRDLLPIERFGALLLRQFRRADIPLEPYSSGPTQTRPRRIYESNQWQRSGDGKHTPVRLAELSAFQAQSWLDLKASMEVFGRTSGLFDEIDVRHLGEDSGDAFQLQIRKGGMGVDALGRNLVDVGYGVSQVLPIVTELLQPSSPTDIYLMQQPEVHLHPSAQAALGNLFCDIAATDRQLIVETHSDHLVDRIRMQVRDDRTTLKPEDVRILYFERNDLDVEIHELGWDESGNIENAPPSYRRFFMEEVERSIWPPD